MRHTKKLLVFMLINIALVMWIGLVEGQKKLTPKLVWEYHSDTPVMLNFSLEKSYPYPVSIYSEKGESFEPKLLDNQKKPLKLKKILTEFTRVKISPHEFGVRSQNGQYIGTIPDFIMYRGEDDESTPSEQCVTDDCMFKCFDIEGNLLWFVKLKDYVKSYEYESEFNLDVGLRIKNISDDGSKAMIGYGLKRTYGPPCGYSIFDSKQGEVFRINICKSDPIVYGFHDATLYGNYLVINFRGEEFTGVRVYSIKSKNLIFKRDVETKKLKPGQPVNARVEFDRYIEFWPSSEEEPNFGIIDDSDVKWLGRSEDYYIKIPCSECYPPLRQMGRLIDENKIIWRQNLKDPIMKCSDFLQRKLLWEVDFSKFINEKISSIGWIISPTKIVWIFISTPNEETIIITFNDKGEKLSEPTRFNRKIGTYYSSFSKDGKYLYINQNNDNKDYWVFTTEDN